jgi:hypothetical protein
MRAIAARPAVVSIALALAVMGCSQTSLQDALRQAETPNCSKSVYRGTAAIEARCFNAANRPIWERLSPKTVAAYDLWQSRRLAIATKFDRGEISAEDYRRGNLLALEYLEASLIQSETSEKTKPTEVIAVLSSSATVVAETPVR